MKTKTLMYTLLPREEAKKRPNDLLSQFYSLSANRMPFAAFRLNNTTIDLLGLETGHL